MSALAEHAAFSSSKIIGVGKNGSGKTGSLLSLVKAGYKLRVLDFDNGTEILANLCRTQCPELLPNIDVETCVDEYQMTKIGSQQQMRPVVPPVGFSKAMNTLADWPGLGKVKDWGPDTVLCVDSLTLMGRVTMNHVMGVKGKLTSIDPKDHHPSQPDWGDAMKLQEDFCARLKNLSCHVIVMSHITFLTPDGEVSQEGFPSALGSKLPPKIGSYFNACLYYGNSGAGRANAVRKIFTKSTNLITTKTPAPGLVKDEYSIETGLADYFMAIHGPMKSTPPAV